MNLVKYKLDTGVLKTILLIFIGTILLTISAKIKIPFYPVPMTMQTLVVLMIGIGFGWKLGVATVILYLFEGIIGLPVLVIQHLTSNKIKMKNIMAGVLLGIPNVLSIVFFLRCLNHYPESSFVFPINNIGIVSVSAISARILFNEHLSKINWLGVFIAGVSIVLLSIA